MTSIRTIVHAVRCFSPVSSLSTVESALGRFSLMFGVGRYIIYDRVMTLDPYQISLVCILILLQGNNCFHFIIYEKICHAQPSSEVFTLFAKNPLPENVRVLFRYIVTFW